MTTTKGTRRTTRNRYGISRHQLPNDKQRRKLERDIKKQGEEFVGKVANRIPKYTGLDRLKVNSSAFLVKPRPRVRSWGKLCHGIAEDLFSTKFTPSAETMAGHAYELMAEILPLRGPKWKSADKVKDEWKKALLRIDSRLDPENLIKPLDLFLATTSDGIRTLRLLSQKTGNRTGNSDIISNTRISVSGALEALRIFARKRFGAEKLEIVFSLVRNGGESQPRSALNNLFRSLENEGWLEAPLPSGPRIHSPDGLAQIRVLSGSRYAGYLARPGDYSDGLDLLPCYNSAIDTAVAKGAIKDAKAVFIKQTAAELMEFKEGLPDPCLSLFHRDLANFFEGCDPRDGQ